MTKGVAETMGQKTSRCTSAPANGTGARPTQTWQPLYFLNIYRLALAGVFSALALLGNMPLPLGKAVPEQFLYTSLLYCLFALLSAVTIHFRFPSFCKQVFAQMLVDILAITLLMDASGGLASGLGMLLVVAVAGGALLIETRTAHLFAAVATLAVLLEHFHIYLYLPEYKVAFTQAGIYGIVFFATTILARFLARRVQASEALARSRGADIVNLERLNALIIERIGLGILVLDGDDRIYRINASAAKLLGLPPSRDKPLLTSVLPELAQQLHQWHDNAHLPPRVIYRANGPDLLPRFTALEDQAKAGGTLAFLEDATRIAARAQQMNLASVGRLTASIAHEIRNPLGAISHAAQLLAESPGLPAADRRLTDIVIEHSRRMNRLIEDVLQLSRRGNTQPEQFAIGPWLQGFVEEFRHSRPPSAPRISIEPTVGPARTEPLVFVDPGHLHQILWNLCRNAVDHRAADTEDLPPIVLRYGDGSGTGTTEIEVVDANPPIPVQVAQQIFEPFFTTRRRGTGLGLYIARQLCQTNRGSLSYITEPGSDSGNRFRLILPNHRPQDKTG